MPREENIVVARKDRFVLEKTPSGKYSIYQMLGGKPKFVKGNLKDESAEIWWSLVDVLLQNEEKSSRELSLEEVVKAHQLFQESLYDHRPRRETSISREFTAPQQEIVEEPLEMIQERVPERAPVYTPTPAPMPIPQRRELSWAAIARGQIPRSIGQVRTPAGRRGIDYPEKTSFKEIVGQAPEQEHWGWEQGR